MSVRLLTRILLLLQAAAALGIAYGLLRWGGAGPWQALLAGAGAVLMARLLVNLNNFILSAWFASATPEAFRLGAAARLRLLAGEFHASMLTTSWRMPRGLPRTALYPDSRAVPVLLLHGYGGNSGYWSRLLPLLDAARISHASIDLEPLDGDIDGYAARVEQAVAALCAATGAPQVAIVAHSMGGLVARAWMRAHGAARLARLVTLGTPHHGSALARFGPGRNAAQMRWNGRRERRRAEGAHEADASAWLRALAASETPATRARITSIWTHHDNMVAPQASSVLAGARNIEFGGVGHVALGSDARVLAEVLRELAASSTPCATASRRGSPA
ncbi:alpha/beta fold hydrolase [Massilia forsythiae]|uniref:Alpha/beta fold hydrolase n=1 Tax=Massilia forsythiae TaxID=2728020 RepID=A0A7Z2W1H0_9BURK|nr:alpha/beta fold hydrolase [Massilia forsythiae]QJE02984.1 alpha/beta fold hydrolase [Massilia forsythiae]